MCIFGAVRNNAPVLSKPSLVDVTWRGRTDKRGISIFHVGTVAAKHLLYSRLSADADPTKQVETRQLHFSEELGAYRLSDAGRRRFLEAFEERLATSIEHPVFGYKASYRRCLELQARLAAKLVMGEIEQYTPFRVR